MADVSNESYLSIGEVLGLLLEEFPDVTISKIRFLESQGLISPERTPSGYRKFYEPDVELLRVILTEQRQNYLPLRVIKDRLDSGEIDPTGEHLRPARDDGEVPPAAEAADTGAPADDGDDPAPAESEVPASAIASHPAAGRASSAEPPTGTNSEGERADETVTETTTDKTTTDEATAEEATAEEAADADSDGAGEVPAASTTQLRPGVLLDRGEFLAMTGLTDDELDQLESFGIVSRRPTSGAPVYDEDAVAIATPARDFLRAGIDARHLRNWRTSAEREASLYEQIITPRFRHRNPEARAEALAQLERLDELGASLRAAMTRQALRHHFDG